MFGIQHRMRFFVYTKQAMSDSVGEMEQSDDLTMLAVSRQWQTV